MGEFSLQPFLEYDKEPKDPAYGKFSISNLMPGYGILLGNAMRRILLSSMPGTAVTTVRINGATHEFTTLPGVKEDVTEIILRIKSVIVKLHCNGPKTVYIEAGGEGIVTAGDIKADADVEILNPELEIATLGPDAALSIELTLNHGRGYVLADQNRPNPYIIGLIPVDSSYNPIKKVNYTVETASFNDNYEKLTLEVWTNGVITACDAVSLSARILWDHFMLFADPEQQSAANGSILVAKALDPMDMPVEDMNLSVRAYNCLKRGNINTLGEIVCMKGSELLALKQMGQRSVDEIIRRLNELGYSLMPEDPV